ncbi:hypothetical protein ACFQO4_20930 [Saliphagus sp. GCM10025334]
MSSDGLQHVLECVHKRTEPEPDGIQDAESNIWTGRRRMKSDGSSSRSPLDRGDVNQVIDQLVEQDEVFEWFGLLAPCTEEYLQAILENEAKADLSRQILVSKVNKKLKELNSNER